MPTRVSPFTSVPSERPFSTGKTAVFSLPIRPILPLPFSSPSLLLRVLDYPGIHDPFSMSVYINGSTSHNLTP